MIINNLYLKNWKQHGELDLDFKEGLNLITGRNMAGKSSILEAISFGLFKKSDFKLKDLVKIGYSGFTIVLVFNVNGEEFSVERIYDNGVSSSNLVNVSSDIFIEGNKEVDQFIIDLIGLNYKEWLNYVYIQQNEMSNLLDLSPGDRKKLIMKYLNLDVLDFYSDKVKGRIKELKESVVEAEINNNEVEHLEELLVPVCELDALRDRLNVAESDKIICIDKVDAYMKLKDDNLSYNHYIENIKRYEELKDDLSKYDEVMGNINVFEFVRGKVEDENDYQYLITEIDHLEYHIDDTMNNLSRVKDLTNGGALNFNNELKKINNTLITSKNDIKELENVKKDAVINHKIYSSRIEDLNNKLNKLNDLDDVCPTCLQPIDGNELGCIEDDYQDELSDLINMQNALTKLIKDLIEDIKEAVIKDEGYIKEYNDLMECIKEYDEINNHYSKSNLDSMIKEKDDSINRLNKIINPLTKDEYNELLAYYHSNQKQYESDIKYVQELSSKRFEFDNLGELEVVDKPHLSLDECLNCIDKYDKLVKDFDQTINALTSDLKYSEKNNIKINDKLRGKSLISIDSLNEELKALEELKDFIKPYNIEKVLLNKFKPVLTQNIQSFLELFDFNYDSVEIDDDYDLIIDSKSSKLASGGERRILSFILRLSIANTLNKKNEVIIIDEPEQSLDKDNKSRLAELIKIITYQQTIIVSHQDFLITDDLNEIKL